MATKKTKHKPVSKGELLTHFKVLHRNVANITPSIYASIAIPLVEEFQWTPDDVEKLFMLSQDEWYRNAPSIGDMIQRCEDLTGIVLRTDD